MTCGAGWLLCALELSPQAQGLLCTTTTIVLSQRRSDTPQLVVCHGIFTVLHLTHRAVLPHPAVDVIALSESEYTDSSAGYLLLTLPTKAIWVRD